jgi:SAM-dependent methyltransferase
MGVDYRSCDLARERLPFEEGSFDFVTYLDVIEHHAFSPKRVLAEIRRVLRPGGRLIATTPNHASAFNRASLLMGRSVHDDFETFFEACADAPVYPGHHREYTLRELRAALMRTSFRVLEMRVTDEDPRAVLRGGGGARAWLHAAAATAGRLGRPFGRILWAVGEK